MSIQDPPNEFLPIYNSINYNYDTPGISQGEADLRYLKLTGGTLSGSLNSTSGLFLNDGSNASPSISFILDSNTGIYRIGNDNLGITCGGVKQVDISTTSAAFTNPLVIPTGTGGSNCALQFIGEANTGLYLSGSAFYINSGGTNMMRFQSSQVYSERVHNFQDGTVTAPGIRSGSYQTTGLYWQAGPTLSVSTNGIQKIDFSTSANKMYQQVDMNSNNIVNCPKVTNTTGNLELAVNSTGAGGTISFTGGTDLLQATAGGSAGLHLKLTINGAAYKIQLLNP